MWCFVKNFIYMQCVEVTRGWFAGAQKGLSTGKSGPAPEAVDSAPVAFRRPSFARVEKRLGFALRGQFEAAFAAVFSLLIERLRDGGGSADVAEGQHLDLKIPARVLHLEYVADMHFAGGLGGLSIGL